MLTPLSVVEFSSVMNHIFTVKSMVFFASREQLMLIRSPRNLILSSRANLPSGILPCKDEAFQNSFVGLFIRCQSAIGFWRPWFLLCLYVAGFAPCFYPWDMPRFYWSAITNVCNVNVITGVCLFFSSLHFLPYACKCLKTMNLKQKDLVD